MSIDKLNIVQRSALQARENVALSAGAGTGKTRVLVERYVQLFLRDPHLGIDNVVAITFTNKAAAEMKFRIRNRIVQMLDGEKDAQRVERLYSLKEEIASAYISTIHAFCARLLREYPAEAGIDPSFETLDEIGARLVLRDVIKKSLVDIAARPAEDATRQAIEMLVRLMSRKTLSDTLRAMFEHRFVAERWCRYYTEAPVEQIVSDWQRYGESALTEAAKAKCIDDLLSAGALKALAAVYYEVRKLNEAQKGPGLYLDFDDLLERTLLMLESHAGLTKDLSARFRHILVDEFHDTDPQQWAILRHFLGAEDVLEPEQLFVVGDPKQSIYGFRNADVRVFSAVRDEILRSNKIQVSNLQGNKKRRLKPAASGEESGHLGDLRMNVNYRSRPEILAFVNHLFERIMRKESAAADYEIEYERLELAPEEQPQNKGSVELIFLQVDSDEADPVEEEAEAIARRIVQIAREDEKSPRRFGDVAILLRRKTKLKTYEAALRKYNVPYITLGGLGFYERQELYDVRNLLRFLFNELDDVALLGALRSEIFAFSDDVIYKISTYKGTSLWEKIKDAAGEESGRLTPQEREMLSAAVSVLEEARADSRHSLPSEFLRRLFDRTALWTAMAASSDGRQRVANVEKLLTIAERFEASGFVSLMDFLEQIDLSIEGEEREGEAQSELDALNAVKIMTVHAAKGLEFPIVIVPHLAGQINYGARDPIWIDPDFGLAAKLADPERDFNLRPTLLRSLLSGYVRARITAEEKRLLYVAATRACERLILCASTSEKSRDSDTQFKWICDALGIDNNNYGQGFIEFAEKIRPAESKPTLFRIPLISKLEDIEPPKDYVSPEIGATKADQRAKPLYEQLDDILTSENKSTRGAEILTLPLPAQPHAEVIVITDMQTATLCPARYFFERFLGILPPELEPRAEAGLSGSSREADERTFAMLRGSLIHQALEEFLSPAASDRKRYAENLIQSEVPGLSDTLQTALLNDILRTLEQFEKSDLARRMGDAEVVLRELPFRLKLGTGFLSGKIDCLFRNGHSRWEVIDFKTDRIARDAAESHSQNYAVQLTSYALYAGSLGKAQEAVATGIYYTEIDYLHSLSYDRSQLQRAGREIENLFSRVARYKAEARSFGGRTLRECLDKVVSWCADCPEKGGSNCMQSLIANLLERIK